MMSDETNEEKNFTLNAMKFVFEQYDSQIPEKYQKELENFDENYPIFFTGDMKMAVIFIQDGFSTVIFSTSYDIGCEEYKRSLENLELHFNLADFLRFMALYLLICALSDSEEDLAKVYNDILNILKSKAPISESWMELDEIASSYINAIDAYCPSLNDMCVDKITMAVGKKFLLKLIDYIFILYFRALPERLELKVNKISPYKKDPFTNNVAHALAILVNNQLEVVERLGEEELVDYYFNLMLRSYTERDFLEFCVSQSRKAFRDFFYSFDYDSPYATYKRMKRMLKRVKTIGSFTTWNKIEEAALQIIQENIERTEREQHYATTYRSKSGVVNEEYKRLERLSDSEKSLEGSSISDKEVADVNALPSPLLNLSLEEETLDTSLLVESKCTCKCCTCS